LQHYGDTDTKKLLKDKEKAISAIADFYKKDFYKKNKRKMKDEINIKRINDIIDLALKLNNESKAFTMSGSIFAAKKIMNRIHNDKKISLLFPCTFPRETNKEIVKVVNIERCDFGYGIVIPQNNKNIDGETILKDDENLRNITIGIGVLLLNYDMIENERPQNGYIQISEKKFLTERIKEFSKLLSKEIENHLKKVAEKIGSKKRIIDIIKMYA
jgi:hypothetical protein